MGWIKHLTLAALLSITLAGLQAQNSDEWLRQKKTQIRYLKKQIALLQAHIAFLQKGYGIAREGLYLVGNIKNKDLRQHLDHFTALLQVNPAIRADGRVRDCLALAGSTDKLAKKCRRDIAAEECYTAVERGCISGVWERLGRQCGEEVDQLRSLLTDREWEMRDDERLGRVETIHKTLQEQWQFARQFSAACRSLAGAKLADSKGLQQISALYGIKVLR